MKAPNTPLISYGILPNSGTKQTYIAVWRPVSLLVHFPLVLRSEFEVTTRKGTPIWLLRVEGIEG